MNLGQWNIRGVGKPNICEELQLVRKINNLNTLVLSETKTHNQPSIETVKHAGFDDITYIPSTGRRGDMWILWKHNNFSKNLDAIGTNDRYIMCSYKDNDIKFVFIFIYAPSALMKRTSSGLISSIKFYKLTSQSLLLKT